MKPLALMLLASLLILPGCPSPGADAPEAPRDEAPRDEVPAVGEGLEAFRPLLGLTEDEARQWLQAHPTPGPEDAGTPVRELRVLRVDDEVYMGTADYRTDRLNVEIDDGRVTVIQGVG